jgi:hypothetical protein
MKNVIKLSAISLYLMISISACAQEEPPIERIIEYATCCGADPVDITIDSTHKLYIPNSFTPNKDSINDVFVPSYTGDIREMQFMQIFSLEGDTLLYVLRGMDADNFANSMFGWDGIRTGAAPNYDGDWKLHKGGFRYEISIYSPDGSLVNLTGKACAIHCGPDAAVFSGNHACFFPSQIDANRAFSPSVSPNEGNCFR